MPNVPGILRQRRARREHTRRTTEQRVRRASLGFGFVFGVLFALLLLAGGWAYVDLTRALPSIERLPVLFDEKNGTLLTPTRLFDNSGQHLLLSLTPDGLTPRYLTLDPQADSHIPATLVNATLAARDPDFKSHSGFKFSALDQPDSHPTIAQQLVAGFLLWNEPPSLRRALRERLLAAQITARFGRDKILEWYLNSANYGRYAYGADVAAHLYFGKSAPDLTLAEAALLAASADSPALNPIDAPQAAVQRQLEIIQAMQTQGLISAEEAAQARAENVTFAPARQTTSLAPAFTAFVLNQLEGQINSARMVRGGYVITTSLDYDLQLQAACLLKSQLSRLNNGADVLTVEGKPCDAARNLSPLLINQSVDSASASAVILDLRNGQVVALVGDIAAGSESASLTEHRAGTSVTPFIYLTGFTRGLNPASLAWDVPGGLSDVSTEIQNLDGRYHGPVRLRVALANDYLVPAGAVLTQIGAENVQRTLASFGITLPDVLTGETALSPLTLAHAYGIFATGGVAYGQLFNGDIPQPAAVLRVETVDHAPVLDWQHAQARQVVTAPLAYLMNHILSDDSVRWPSLGRPSPLDIGRPAGAKLAQTPDRRDLWVAGYTPQYALVVWMGAQTQLETAPIMNVWSALMQYATRAGTPAGWDTPPGVTLVDVCDPSGLLPTRACPSIVREAFLTGNEPIQPDDLYQTFDINRETNLLATIFPPPQMIEPRVYLVVPAAAQAWAEAAGLSTPPETYDTIQAPLPSPEVHITSPGMFSDIYGMVPVIGSAGGKDFLYYRVQYGTGLNPQKWIQIGRNTAQTLTEDTLVEWDTSQLNGLYALQLQVVKTDNSLETATIQVMIDNLPPQLTLDFPIDGATYALRDYKHITLQPTVTDNLFLTKVDVYIDATLLDSMSAAPFTVTWTARAGQHTLRVVAVDRAGNKAEQSISFRVSP